MSLEEEEAESIAKYLPQARRLIHVPSLSPLAPQPACTHSRHPLDRAQLLQRKYGKDWEKLLEDDDFEDAEEEDAEEDDAELDEAQYEEFTALGMSENTDGLREEELRWLVDMRRPCDQQPFRPGMEDDDRDHRHGAQPVDVVAVARHRPSLDRRHASKTKLPKENQRFVKTKSKKKYDIPACR